MISGLSAGLIRRKYQNLNFRVTRCFCKRNLGFLLLFKDFVIPGFVFNNIVVEGALLKGQFFRYTSK